jgi:hypothetical protein
MRKALVSTAEYFEADLTAFTTTKTLKDAVSTRRQFEIPFGSFRPFLAKPEPLKPKTPVTILKLAPGADEGTVKHDDTVEGAELPRKPEEPTATILAPVSINNDDIAKINHTVEGSDLTGQPEVTQLTPVPIQEDVAVQLDHAVHGLEDPKPAETLRIATMPARSPAVKPQVTILTPTSMDKDHRVQMDNFVDRLRPMSNRRLLKCQ